MATRWRALVSAAVVTLLLAACGAPPQPSPVLRASPPSSVAAASGRSEAQPTPVPALTASTLSELLEPGRLNAHLLALQAIADESGGNRATGTAGFERSVDYVVGVLESAGYGAQRQAFTLGAATSWNVLAERAGSGDGVIVVGAHLDSVAAGPGINDNASGVAAVLAIAEALPALPAPSVTIRFALWGAEEGGPFGSDAYLAALDDAARGSIRAYVNLDMLASPNGVTFVYDEPSAASGSEAITNTITTYFERRGLPWEPIDLEGDSDHGPFISAGIPSGGLFAGGIEPVTAEQARRHGARADQPADPCSHAACDTIDNVDLARLALLTDALAAVIVALAASPAG